MKKSASILFLWIFIIISIGQAQVVINEFMASNSDYFQDPDEAGEYPDWIELYNPSGQSVNVGGLYLTDNPARPTKWQIAQGTQIPAGGFIFFIADSDPEQGTKHTSFKLDSQGGYIGLVHGDGSTILDSLTYSKQYSDVSYGRSPDGGTTWYFFDTPTPEKANAADGYLGKIDKVQFSHVHGFYENSFSLSLSVDNPQAKIFYTLDGSEPRDRTGAGTILYSAPIPITTTSYVRARAFLDGWKSKNSVTNTFIFLEDVLWQPDDPDGFPQNWGWTGYGDYEMDPDVVDDPAYVGTIIDDLKSIPSMSLVMDIDDWFGEGGQGIYLEGELDERAVSAELIHPDGSEGFQINCAVMIVGGSSTGRWKMDKLSMRLKFQNEYGAADLDYQLFGDNATDQFQTLVLDARMNNSWAYGGGTGINGRDLKQNDIAQYTRDNFVAELQLAMDGLAPHGRQVHLYLNGLYWGLYWVHERPDEHFAASYRGDAAEDYDVLKHNANSVVSGENTNYRAMFNIANSGRSVDEKYQLLSEYLDIPDLINYMIVNYYVGNVDWAHQNWYATRSRFAPEDKWRYHSWDAEHVMEGVQSNNLHRDDDGGPTRLHHVLRQHPEYRRMFADQVYQHFFNDGILTQTRVKGLYQKLLDEVDRAVVGESARWGDNHREKPYTRNVEWVTERDWLMNSYFPQRGDIVLEQLRDYNLYPDLAAPIFLVDGSVQHGGQINSGARITMSAANGTIYYTMNGEDPLVTEVSNLQELILVPQSATKRVLVATNNIGVRWRSDPNFNDTEWHICQGEPGGIGYETESGYQSLITLDVENAMYDAGNNKPTSCFVRIPFTLTAEKLNTIKTLLLKVRYDDGFVAYLNGTQVAIANAPNDPAWDAAALDNHEAETVETFNISSQAQHLKVGENILALQAMNVHSRSSDFLITAELSSSDNSSSGSVSPNAKEYTGSITLSQSVNIKARATNGSEWSPLHDAIYAIPEKMEELRITEIHFHPLDENDANDREFEFLELKNIGSTPIDLSLARFQNGVRYTFATGTLMQPGAFIVLASNAEKFKSRYNMAPFAAYEGNLDNAGERIAFINAAGDTIINVRFNDKDPWPESADGDGYSLVANEVNPNGDPNNPAYWGASYRIHGSPGRDDNTATDIIERARIPQQYALAQNYPNPFNPTTTIRFDVPISSQVKIELYNILGQHLLTLVENRYDPGIHSIAWDAGNYAAGIYFYRMRAGDFTATKRLLLMK
ncbi:lamin tail domain-containing protein [candidate division KSB1 bacterium]|nr:lamin tail domain-containing protein [candidate division KSB1 bacterium]